MKFLQKMDEQKIIQHIPLKEDIETSKPNSLQDSFTIKKFPFNWHLVYDYYIYHGFQIYLMKHVFSLLILVFITIISFYLFAVNWVDLLNCSEIGCLNLDAYIDVNLSTNIWSVFFIGNLCTLALAILFSLLLTVNQLISVYKFKNFLNQRGIYDNDMIAGAWSWSEFLNRLNTVYPFYNKNSTSIAIPTNPNPNPNPNNDQLDQLIDEIHDNINDDIMHDISDITYLPNSQIQMINNYILRVFEHEREIYSHLRNPDMYVRNTVIHSNVLHWVLSILLSDIDILQKLSVIHRTSILNKRVRYTGILILMIYPFLIITSFLYVILKHSEQLHSKDYLGPRIWTIDAKYKFQCINELPHEFDLKLQEASTHAEKYLNQFPIYSLHELCKFIRFLSASILTILSAIALYDENIILNVTFINRNLVFYLAVFTVIFYICSYNYNNSKFTPEIYMQKILVALGFDENKPDKAETIILSRYLYWQDNARSYEVCNEVSALFRYKIINLLYELYAIIMLPYTLICKLKFTV